jgi:hypothetical protein
VYSLQLHVIQINKLLRLQLADNYCVCSLQLIQFLKFMRLQLADKNCVHILQLIEPFLQYGWGVSEAEAVLTAYKETALSLDFFARYVCVCV